MTYCRANIGKSNNTTHDENKEEKEKRDVCVPKKGLERETAG